ncbi:hypothetical protein [Paracoccus zhejiangensis]|uniref:hypothetical protein n=1 Tax=Paracoccus zhejiangensis TaxID=1077935 RepID=UPI00130001A6|nr:hypothetical protein [Paracoccus zhejiangensis]
MFRLSGLIGRWRRLAALALLALAALISAPTQSRAEWGGWESLGGVVLEEQSCTSWGANRIDCFARGTDRAMYHRWWDGSNWGGWENLGGVILDSPECVSWGANRIDCFARGTDAAMYHRWWDGSNWGGWENLGGVLLDKPDCVTWSANRIDCFARGTDAAMYHRWWDGRNWGGWENLGGVLLDRPDCTAWAANRIDCFARGTDAAMYHRWWDGRNWGGWENLGGTILETPNCTSWSANRIDCFARGTDRAMYHRWWDGRNWGGWENLGGTILEAPDCVNWGANRIDCFARGLDRAMYHRWWDGQNWGGWESLGGTILEQPECVSWGTNRLDCFARGTDRAMWHRWWSEVQPRTVRALTIRRHNTLAMTDGQADSILNDLGTVLTRNDGPGDVACAVGVTRNGAVGAFAETDGNLNTNAEVQQVFGLNGNIKVVPTVDFCGSAGFNTSIIGCGQTPGASFITERFTATQEGILWAHEFGHNTGLPHRTDTSDALMFPSIGSNRLRINASECGSYGGSALVSAFIVPVDMTVEAGGGNEAALMPVEEFVRQVWFEGLPLDVAARYSPADAQTLLNMLNDPAEVLYHENIANVIGMIGDPASTAALIDYVEQGPAGEGGAEGIEPDRAAAMAEKGRVSALVALGYIANRSEDPAALDYLIASTEPRVWTERDFAPVTGLSPETGAQDRTLSEYALIALGLSARPEAIAHLESLQGGGLRDGSFRATIQSEIGTALDIAGEVQTEGDVVDYYRNR